MTKKRQLRKEQKPAQQTDRGKRGLIQKSFLGVAIVSGMAYPKYWVRPVVESVVLPAHAQTSFCSGVFSGSVSGFCSNGQTIEFTVAGPSISAIFQVVKSQQKPERNFNGNGIIATDGSINIVLTEGGTLSDVRIIGSLGSNCGQITGIIDDADKTDGAGFCFDTGTFTAVKQ